MSVRRAAIEQYQAIVNRAAASMGKQPSMTHEGWIATVRKALGMSAAQLARRLGVSRARISHAERSELSRSLTLKTMQMTAEAMGCRFVYAIVPVEGRVESVIAAQAHRKAQAIVAKASAHMWLENQSLTSEKDRAEVERLSDELARTMPADLWTEK